LSVMRTPVALPPSLTWNSAMQQQRHRFKRKMSLEQRLVAEANRCREEARRLPLGPLRETLLRKARLSEMAALMDEWLRPTEQRAGEEGDRTKTNTGASRSPE